MKTNRKRIGIFTASSLMVITLLSGYHAVFASPAPTVFLNGKAVEFDVQPQYIHERAYVPFRKLLEALGAKVEWDEGKQTATATKDGLALTIPLGSKTISLQGHPLTMDVPAVMVEYRTLVPLRFVAQALGAKVDWTPSAAGDRIEMTQSYEGMIDRMVNGATAEGDQKVTYEQAAILFEWLEKGQEKGELPGFTGNEVPKGIPWNYTYDYSKQDVLTFYLNLDAKYPNLDINEKSYIKTNIFRIEKYEWTNGSDVLFMGFAVWDTTRAPKPWFPPYEGVEMSHYLPKL